MLKKLILMTACLCLLGSGALAYAEDIVDVEPWHQLLQRYVDESGLVDYEGLSRQQKTIREFLVEVAHADLQQPVTQAEKMTFYINAYNASVVVAILEQYPIKSVKKVKGFFDAAAFDVGGASLTLDALESQLRTMEDARVHYALVCGALSCPPLRNEAYRADTLDYQLQDQARRFLQDPARGIEVLGKMVKISSIFKWYQKDFLPDGVSQWEPQHVVDLAQNDAHLQLQEALKGVKKVKFLRYDWGLNDQNR